MINYNFIALIEKTGYINNRGQHIYGTAALLHFLHRPIKNLSQSSISRGKAFVEKYLSA